MQFYEEPFLYKTLIAIKRGKNMNKEQKFYNTLKDIFVGAKIEGESGYINLMRIKSRYYEKGVFPILQKDINTSLEPFTEFKEEFFDKLYTFFNRYFSESGSIYFRYTPIHQNIYEKVYTNDKDVILFWKTHMLYYVKTDRLFKNLGIEIDSFKFFFDVSRLEHKKTNEKREIIYEFKEKRKDKTIIFNVFYSERGRKTKIDEILKALNKEGIRIAEDSLENAFRVFKKQSEVDYFINKNAKEFLKEQFNIWFYQYVFSGESEWTEKRIKQLQILRNIAFKIISFISQFEDELVRIWNKPKFVFNSNYVITFDKIVNTPSTNTDTPLKEGDLIEKIIAHKNINEQINEWQELGIVDEHFDVHDVIEIDLIGKHLNKKYKHLPIDTIYFKDLELEILGLFDDLDSCLNGWLIKSENYQALNTILPKFKERVQTIYIDPPFNKEQDADYFYSIKYKDASWITLLENRLQLTKDVLNPTGSIFVRCDYNGNMYVRLLMNEIFGEGSYKNEIILSKSAKVTEQINKYHSGHDSLFFCTKSEKYDFKTATKKRENQKWRSMHLPGIRWSPLPQEYVSLFSKENVKEKNEKFVTRTRIILGKELLPPEGRHWALSQKGIFELEKESKIRLGENGEPQTEEPDLQKLTDNWTDWVGYSSHWGFATENHEKVIKRAIETSSLKEYEIILDFFLGSGTTTAVAHKLKRKWIGVEMGEHFYTVVLPRMKKVLAYDKSGISKEKDVKAKYNGNNAGGFFKYYELEQYEDALRKVKYEDADLFDNPNEDPYNQYIFMRDLKMLEALNIDYENNKVKVNLSRLYPNIDIPETLSNLTGKWIKRITKGYVEFKDGEKVDIKNLDYKLIKPLIWW
jgi:adenine specific DNA methylase Mod